MAEAIRRRAAIVLVALVVAAYANAVFLPFLYDDHLLVVQNPHIRSLTLVPEMIGFHDDGFVMNTRWTRTITHAVEYSLVGLWSPLYHATNIALHATLVLLILALARRVLRDDLVAFGTAAIFAVHPIHTEVVTHVSGRRELLATLFALIFLTVMHSYVRRGGWWRPAAAGAALVIGVCSKANVVMAAPAFVLVHLYSELSRARDESEDRSLARTAMRIVARHRWLYGTMGALSLGLVVVRLFLTAGALGLDGSPSHYELVGQFGPLDRAGLFGWAVRMFFLPLGQTIDYSFDALGTTSGAWAGARAIGIGLAAALCAVTVVGLRRKHPLGLAGAWFVVFYVPHLGLVPWHEVFAERFLYLPAVGLCIGVASVGAAVWRFCERLRSGERWRWGAAAAAALVVAALGVATHVRNEAWNSERALWEDAVSKRPNAAKSHKALADHRLVDGRPDLAEAHYRLAVSILPAYQDAQVGLAAALIERRRFAEAFTHLDAVLERWPKNPRALAVEGLLHSAVGQREQAIEAYESSLAANPEFGDAYLALGRLYLKAGQVDLGVAMLGRAAAFEASKVEALHWLAAVHRRLLADPERADAYEKQAWEALRSRATGAPLVGLWPAEAASPRKFEKSR